MKKHLLIAATLIIMTAPISAWSQNVGGGAPPPPPAGGSEPGPVNGTPAQNQQMFQQRKTEILQHMQERMACVQAATNHQALMACMPRREGMGGMGGMGHGGQVGGAPGGNSNPPAPGGGQ